MTTDGRGATEGNGMTRAEHVAWCKRQALEYVDQGDPANALMSMLSDLGKHPDTARHTGIALTMMLLRAGSLTTVDDVRRHIDGFN